MAENDGRQYYGEGTKCIIGQQQTHAERERVWASPFAENVVSRHKVEWPGWSTKLDLAAFCSSVREPCYGIDVARLGPHVTCTSDD